MKRTLIALFAVATLGITMFAINPAGAQDKMSGGKMNDKMAASTKMVKVDKSVYVCKACKAYFSSSIAKKMAYKDPMGHKMVKMDKAPAGFKDGSKMAMNKGGKMGGKMDSGKMEGGKM